MVDSWGIVEQGKTCSDTLEVPTSPTVHHHIPISSIIKYMTDELVEIFRKLLKIPLDHFIEYDKPDKDGCIGEVMGVRIYQE